MLLALYIWTLRDSKTFRVRNAASDNGSACYKKFFVLSRWLAVGLTAIATDLGFCVVCKGEIIELTLQADVALKQAIPATRTHNV
jgi:hypothetical protein